MRLERKSLITLTLLFFAGCSAGRQARQSESKYESTDPVQIPMRHADEYDSNDRDYDYEYEPAPSSNDTPSRSRTPVPPPVPMQEPVPAPPAIGISRVKSVSWLRAGNNPEKTNCGDDPCGDNCGTGQQSQFPTKRFTEGCVAPPQTEVVPRSRCREKTTLVELIQGWQLRAKIRRSERVQTSHNCGERTGCDPGFITPEGCNTSGDERDSCRASASLMKQSVGGARVCPNTATQGNHGGSLADPLSEDGWDEHVGADDQRFSPEEMLELRSTLENPAEAQKSQNVPAVPETESTPLLPIPDSAPKLLSPPETQNPAPPAAVPQQSHPDSVKRIVQPPMWPRLGPAAATSNNVPFVSPAVPHDSSLPIIQPGRRT